MTYIIEDATFDFFQYCIIFSLFSFFEKICHDEYTFVILFIDAE